MRRHLYDATKYCTSCRYVSVPHIDLTPAGRRLLVFQLEVLDGGGSDLS